MTDVPPLVTTTGVGITDIKKEQLHKAPVEEEIRTLFISGLPPDCKEREVYGLFRGVEGFEFANIKSDSSPVGFAVFTSQAFALKAMQLLKGQKFDLSDTREGPGLKIELAKNNSRPKRDRSGFSSTAPDEKRHKTGSTSNEQYAAYAAVAANAGLDPTLLYQQSAYQAAVDPFALFAAQQVQGAAFARSPSAAGMGSNGASSSSSNPPCTTVFVANLGATTSENEIKELFSRAVGFKRMKFQPSGRQGPVAFVDFENEILAGVALSQLQGYMLPSCDRGGIRVEFARKPMGGGQPRGLAS